MNCARMNSIYIKYTYIALYLGRALSLFSLSHFKNEVLLPLSVVQPSSSQLAKLCLRWLKTGNQRVCRTRRWTCHPPGVRGPCHLPCPRGCGWGRRLVSGVGFGSVLGSVVSGPGEGGLCRLLLSCTFCSAALQYCINARKGE